MAESKYKHALQQIAAGRDLCETCGEPHEFRLHDRNGDPRYGGTWAAPGGTWAAPDGHAYRRVAAKVYAQRVLDGA